MTGDSILCATDLSPHSVQVVRYASAMARQTGATLLLVHVIRPGRQESSAECEALLERVAPPHNVPCERVLREGDPVDEILKLAHDQHVAQIVIGTHGQPGFHSVKMGHTAERVVESAHCPVTVVRDEPIESKAAD